MRNIIYDTFIAWMLLKFSKCHTIMLFGFVFSKLKKHEMTQATRSHEMVHVRQWCEVTFVSALAVLALIFIFGLNPSWLLISSVVFYAWYIIEYICKGVWYSIMIDEWTCDMETPYEAISFEREARLANSDPNYLENNGYFGWLKHL